ncbi:MAG: hypothetical protein JO033_15410 [Acidobacteriaceae bacterium]|nr:hypothetical protein [Acidobacteriaceae bacterium]
MTTAGFPFMSSAPLPASSGPLPQGGNWMSFFLLRLPAGFEASNRNAEGFATGTLTIKAPSDALVGAEYLVGIFADNGVQPQAEQDLYIKIAKPTEPAP